MVGWFVVYLTLVDGESGWLWWWMMNDEWWFVVSVIDGSLFRLRFTCYLLPCSLTLCVTRVNCRVVWGLDRWAVRVVGFGYWFFDGFGWRLAWIMFFWRSGWFVDELLLDFRLVVERGSGVGRSWCRGVMENDGSGIGYWWVSRWCDSGDGGDCVTVDLLVGVRRGDRVVVLLRLLRG